MQPATRITTMALDANDKVHDGWLPGDKMRGGHWVPGARLGVLWKLRNGEFRNLQQESKRWPKYYEDFCERMTYGNGENHPNEAEDVDRIRWHFIEESILSFMKFARAHIRRRFPLLPHTLP